MTLTEYLNQDNPERMPKVILNNGEYQMGITVNYGRNTITQVFIQSPEFNKAFPSMTNEYVIIGNEDHLFTQDGQGKPKNPSCFYLPKM